MVAPLKHAKKAFISAVVGTVLVALCCFTPVLVLVLSILGVGFLTPYLDYVLFPAGGHAHRDRSGVSQMATRPKRIVTPRQACRNLSVTGPKRCSAQQPLWVW